MFIKEALYSRYQEEMIMKVNAAFIFVAPETDSKTSRAVIETPVLILNVIGVKNYEEGVAAAVQILKVV